MNEKEGFAKWRLGGGLALAAGAVVVAIAIGLNAAGIGGSATGSGNRIVMIADAPGEFGGLTVGDLESLDIRLASDTREAASLMGDSTRMVMLTPESFAAIDKAWLRQIYYEQSVAIAVLNVPMGEVGQHLDQSEISEASGLFATYDGDYLAVTWLATCPDGRSSSQMVLPATNYLQYEFLLDWNTSELSTSLADCEADDE